MNGSIEEPAYHVTANLVAQFLAIPCGPNSTSRNFGQGPMKIMVVLSGIQWNRHVLYYTVLA